jgi:hypothetical protein
MDTDQSGITPHRQAPPAKGPIRLMPGQKALLARRFHAVIFEPEARLEILSKIFNIKITKQKTKN